MRLILVLGADDEECLSLTAIIFVLLDFSILETSLFRLIEHRMALTPDEKSVLKWGSEEKKRYGLDEEIVLEDPARWLSLLEVI